ncbi:MAG: AAA-like domain-containing protein, partial [Clostridiales Family XIII bacterium]|nr:AAA-like domain-containing protein [Clostridiales Family XIII bacterium]
MKERARYFNITGPCIPGKHYMVDIGPRLRVITRDYIERGEYFTINRPRQYGKTTTLFLLQKALAEECLAIRMSFEGRDSYFESLEKLVNGVKTMIGKRLELLAEPLSQVWNAPFSDPDPLEALREHISSLCTASEKPVVVLIDEVDKATNYQVFNAFLGLLRDMYIDRYEAPTFQSVILAGVTDIKNLKRKIRPEEHSGVNSPWNIAADFTVDMSFAAP